MELPESAIDEKLHEVLEVIAGMKIDQNEIYIDIGDYYIVGDHRSPFIWKSAEEKTLFISIYKNGKFIAGYNFK